MKFTDIIICACKLLKKEDLLVYSQIVETSNLSASGGDLDDINTLKNCLNLVINEIACDYFPLRKEENFTTENGKIMLDNFTNNFLKIEKITDEYGRNIRYYLFPDYIKTNTGKVCVKYFYQPTEVSFGDNIESFFGRVPERVFAYGVAREFCFIMGMYDDATMWDKRFTDALKSLEGEIAEKKVKARRWL